MKCSRPTHGFSCLPEIINYISMNEKRKENNATCASWNSKHSQFLFMHQHAFVNRRTYNYATIKQLTETTQTSL